MRILLLVCIASAALAQSTGGIRGTVLDRLNAPIAGVVLQAKSADQTYSARSDASGQYSLSGLPAGKYQLTAASPGLAPFERTVNVEKGETRRLDLQLNDLQLNTLGEDRAYYTGLMSAHDVPRGAAPRTPDGKPDLSGVWLPSFPRDPGNPQPLAWAAEVMKQRAANDSKDIPSAHCLPLGVVMSTFLFPYGFVQTPKLLVMMYEGEFPRQIFLDGRAHPQDLNPSWLGHSVGHWEGDTLVVDTVGFNGKAWIDFAGHPASEKLHIIERYRRPDLAHLELEITIDDPGAYAKPWTIRKTSELSRDDTLMEYICNENERDLSHMGK